MVTRQMTLYFSYTLRALSVGIFHLCIYKTFKIQFHGVPFVLCYGLKNTHLHTKDETFKPLNIDIFFLRKIC